MTRANLHFVARRRMAGLSLIEMMIALIMALIVAAGIITVFTSTSSSNRAQAQLAALQEAGRFAIHSLRSDLSNANGAYCSNSGGNATARGSGLYLDALRSPIIYAPDVGAIDDNTVNVVTPTQPWVLPSNLYMRGYNCNASECKPVDPNTSVSAIPAMGTAVNDRVKGADVLTIRYLKPGTGWAIVPSGSSDGTTLTAAGGAVTAITINPRDGSDEPDASHFVSGDLAMLATCSSSKIYAVGTAGAVLTPTGANYSQPSDISQDVHRAPRLFDFSKDFQTVTYYLRVVDAGNSHTTGELVRRVNGVDHPLVRGVERLDFRYGIMDADGGTRFLNADEVDAGVDADGNSIPCPPQMGDTNHAIGGVTRDPVGGCLWRAVQTIEVHVLMDGQTPLYTLTDNEMKYVYTPDGDVTPEAPEDHDIKPGADQGFPKQLIRREFTTLVTLRNFNP